MRTNIRTNYYLRSLIRLFRIMKFRARDCGIRIRLCRNIESILVAPME